MKYTIGQKVIFRSEPHGHHSRSGQPAVVIAVRPEEEGSLQYDIEFESGYVLGVFEDELEPLQEES